MLYVNRARFSDVRQVQTRLVGDVILGPEHEDPGTYHDALLSENAPITLIYGELLDGESVPFIKAYHPKPPLFQATRRFAIPHREPGLGLGSFTHFSSAPLNKVVSARVFCHEESKWGILFKYENGGLQTVGQCRLHVDFRNKYARPSSLCLRASTFATGDWRRELRGTRVKFRSPSGREHGHEHHEHDSDEWQCYPMKGILEYRFSAWCSSLSTTGN